MTAEERLLPDTHFKELCVGRHRSARAQFPETSLGLISFEAKSNGKDWEGERSTCETKKNRRENK